MTTEFETSMDKLMNKDELSLFAQDISALIFVCVTDKKWSFNKSVKYAKDKSMCPSKQFKIGVSDARDKINKSTFFKNETK